MIKRNHDGCDPAAGHAHFLRSSYCLSCVLYTHHLLLTKDITTIKNTIGLAIAVAAAAAGRDGGGCAAVTREHGNKKRIKGIKKKDEPQHHGK